jgi:hypothetical protein
MQEGMPMKWHIKEWFLVVLVLAIGAVAGFVGSLTPLMWFQHGVCW